MRSKKPITRQIMRMDAKISDGCEPVILKLNNNKENEIIEKRSVRFRYLILLTTFYRSLLLHLLIIIGTKRITSITMKIRKRIP
jgi:hypothetical protein